jgi:CheY-like chemotaxis protein
MASRILLADDSITIQKVVNLTFADEGIEVVSVSNGEQAEKRLGEINPDLVLADIFMPGKNGYELCEFIKQNPRFCDVPVVLLVGAFEPFDQTEARRVKADTHLTKPFESRVLVETVRRLIGKSSKTATDSFGSTNTVSMAAPVEESSRTELPVETRSMASPLLNIDLNAMSGPASQSDTVPFDQPSVTSASGFQTLSDSSPLDLDYSTFMQGPVEPDQSQAAALFEVTEDGFRHTQQLASLSAQEQAEALSVQQVESSVMVEEEQPARDLEGWPESRSGTPSIFGYSPQEVLLDFDKVQSPETPGPENVVSLDLDSAAPAVQEAVVSEELPAEDELDTGKLERPAKEAAQAAATGGFEDEDSEENEDVVRETIGPATSLLLSADNPFDVLFGDRPQEAGVTEAPPAVSQAPAGEETLALSDAVEEPASMEPLSPVDQFSTLEMSSEAASAPSVADEQEAETAAPKIAAREDLAQDSEAVAEAAEPGFEVSSEEIAESPDEYEQPLSSATSSETEDESFTTASMWTEAETRFTPIDIEAVSVDETAPLAPQAEAAMQETGFEFQQVVEERPAAEAAQPATQEEAAAPQAGQTTALSPEVIDDIVRRVVAQMSDQVVREIAWEVVPDCVERIIKEMARDSLPK